MVNSFFNSKHQHIESNQIHKEFIESADNPQFPLDIYFLKCHTQIKLDFYILKDNLYTAAKATTVK